MPSVATNGMTSTESNTFNQNNVSGIKTTSIDKNLSGIENSKSTKQTKDHFDLLQNAKRDIENNQLASEIILAVGTSTEDHKKASVYLDSFDTTDVIYSKENIADKFESIFSKSKLIAFTETHNLDQTDMMDTITKYFTTENFETQSTFSSNARTESLTPKNEFTTIYSQDENNMATALITNTYEVEMKSESELKISGMYFLMILFESLRKWCKSKILVFCKLQL